MLRRLIFRPARRLWHDRKHTGGETIPPGDLYSHGCSTEYCSSTLGRCGFCGWDWGSCDCHSSDWHCPCGRKQEGSYLWNALTVFWFWQIKRRWWEWSGWWYGEGPLSDWYYARWQKRQETVNE